MDSVKDMLLLLISSSIVSNIVLSADQRTGNG